eukprot:NODE_680_length_5258_cov_0.588486.p3 type:complete len:112 gc:universal NODE_680_length_5258_cov_0.588486:4917-4582(-)
MKKSGGVELDSMIKLKDIVYYYDLTNKPKNSSNEPTTKIAKGNVVISSAKEVKIIELLPNFDSDILEVCLTGESTLLETTTELEKQKLIINILEQIKSTSSIYQIQYQFYD